MEKQPPQLDRRNIWMSIGKVLVCLVIGVWALKTQVVGVRKAFVVLGLLSAGYLMFDVLRLAKNAFVLILLLVLIVILVTFFTSFLWPTSLCLAQIRSF